MSPKRKNIINSDNYLFTKAEAALLFRMNRKKFEELYIKSGKIPLYIDESGRELIRSFRIRQLIENNEYKEV